MIRVVFDTNVVLSSLLQPLGLPAKAFSLVRRGFLQLCVSGPVFAEYEEVIRRPRFCRIEEAIEPTLHFIRVNGLWIRPTETVRVCSDPDDDVFLECAHAANASWLVTGNVKHFPTVWRGVEVATPRRFLDAIAVNAERQ